MLEYAGTGATWSSDHPLILLHRYLRNRGVRAIPVTATDRHGEYYAAISVAAKEGRNGLAIRLYESDIELPFQTFPVLKRIASDAGFVEKDVDLFLDLQRVQFQRLPELRSRVLDFLASLDSESTYRSVTLIGSSVPADLSGIPELEDRDVHRMELRLWRDIRVARGDRPLLGFGDYGIVRPEYDDRRRGFKHINAKIFYTTQEFTRVFRGQSRIKEKLENQYSKLAQRLVGSGVFSGAAFSWGDARIVECARHQEGYGTPGTWIAFATSHHVEVVSAQFAQEMAKWA